jgi:hypothetical protein
MPAKKPITVIRKSLISLHKAGYRIRKITPDQDMINQQAFIRILENLKKIEDRRDFMVEEIGMDVTLYEETFFSVIEDLFKLTFTKDQLALIQMYLYQLHPDKDWDGTITVQHNKKEVVVNFRTPTDVWNVLTNYSK